MLAQFIILLIMIFVSKHYIEKLKGANLMKKIWTDASVEELVIEATAGGGTDVTENDGVYVRDPNTNKVYAEQVPLNS